MTQGTDVNTFFPVFVSAIKIVLLFETVFSKNIF